MKKILSFILVFILGTTLFASEKFIRMLQLTGRADGGIIVGVYDMEPKFKTTFENKEPKYIILENDLNRKKAEGYVKQLKLLKLLQSSNDNSVPILLYMNRPTTQKGIDLFVDLKNGKKIDICSQMNNLTKNRCIFIICGDCEDKLTSPIYQQLKTLDSEVENFYYIDNYSDDFAHVLLLASDFYLLPSRYEPCGLSQLYAMRYGVLPIVNPVGGLKDTVINLDEDINYGTGIYMRNYSFEAILEALDTAIELYASGHWNDLIKRLLNINYSWSNQILEYLKFIA